jgi:hypothetical protein
MIEAEAAQHGFNRLACTADPQFAAGVPQELCCDNEPSHAGARQKPHARKVYDYFCPATANTLDERIVKRTCSMEVDNSCDLDEQYVVEASR